jgi:hypothetical protein
MLCRLIQQRCLAHLVEVSTVAIVSSASPIAARSRSASWRPIVRDGALLSAAHALHSFSVAEEVGS